MNSHFLLSGPVLWLLGQLILAAANLSVSGVVTDLKGIPVPSAMIWAHGSNQPNQYTITDMTGKYVVEGICAGQIIIGTGEHNSKETVDSSAC